MIIYDFQCENSHTFEGWFSSADDCQSQLSKHMIACPVCNTTQVSKELAAPAVHISRSPKPVAPKVLAQNEAGQRTTLFRAYVDAVRKVIDTECENVGPRFAEEATAMHDGETEERNIVGTSTIEEEKVLESNGIPFQKLYLPKFDD